MAFRSEGHRSFSPVASLSEFSPPRERPTFGISSPKATSSGRAFRRTAEQLIAKPFKIPTPFNQLTPREKSKSPRIPGALFLLYADPAEEQHRRQREWFSGLPKNEQHLRRILRSPLPGILSPRQVEEPKEVIEQRRQDQAQKLQLLLTKVQPTKEAEESLVLSARRRLDRLKAPLPEPCPQVSAEAAALGLCTFRKAIPTQPPMTQWLDSYVQRKGELGTKLLQLKSGRIIAYWTDGPEDGLPVLLIHGIGFGREQWIQPSMIPGAYLISIDRLGYGQSSDDSEESSSATVTADHIEFLEALGIQDFCIVGHGLGGGLGLDLAAALASSNRVKAMGLLSPTPDYFHDLASDSHRIECGVPLPAFVDAKIQTLKEQSFISDRPKVLDWGMADWIEHRLQTHPELGGQPEICSEMLADPFFVCALLDCQKVNSQQQLVKDYTIALKSGFAHDWTFVCCPVSAWYCGQSPEAAVALIQDLLPHSNSVHLKEHGHFSILRLAREVIEETIAYASPPA
jgi:pimeloyl-ACP methyl ester carboxylesterase